MKRFAFWFVILLLLIGGFYFYDVNYQKKAVPTPEDGWVIKEQDSANQENKATATDTDKANNLSPALPKLGEGENKQSEGSYSSGEEGAGMAPDILVVQIEYDGKAYTPSAIKIKKGDVVIFKNNSSGSMWPASDPHPSHELYPEFDAKKAISPGGKFQFKFEKTGVWTFHDHLNPESKGSVEVTP